MPTYIAHLGHQPKLSLAELSARLPDFSVIRLVNKNVAVFTTQYELSPEFLNELGGTMVLAKQTKGGDAELTDVPKTLKDQLAGAKRGKVVFSLRTTGLSPQKVKHLYRNCKQTLRQDGRASRYVGNERKAVLPVVLHENDMIEGKQGCEIVVVHDDDEDNPQMWIGRTVAAHDVDAYTKRDVGKPVRDTAVGLLPPKLAQTMLNAGAWAVEQAAERAAKPAAKKGKAASKKTAKKKDKPATPPKHKSLKVLDPFCGTGVIPLECLLRGWPVHASDKMQKAVSGCSKNLDWMRKEEKIAKKDVPSSVQKHDATKPFPFKENPDVIVTETSLGPALAKRPTLKEVQKWRTENEQLQADFLRNVAETYPGTPVVCTWPVWYTSKGSERLTKIWSVVDELGYEAVLPTGLEAAELRPGTEQTEQSLIYRRPDQFVGREMVILVPKGEAEDKQ